MALISQTALISEDDHFDFAAPPKVELGYGDNFSLKKLGGVNHIVLKASYEAPSFIGTAGADNITNADPGVKTLVGGGGNDVVNSGNNATSQTLYGDDVQAGFTIGSTYGKPGNDVLHLGAGDTGKSGAGLDLYVLHGPFKAGPHILNAKVYANLMKDAIQGLGDDPFVSAFEVTKYSANKTAVLLKSFTLQGDDFFGPNAVRFINPEVERGKALEGDALDMWVSTGADKKISLAEVHDAVGMWETKHNFLVEADGW